MADNKIESLEINLHIYGQIIFNQDGSSVQEKGQFFSINSVGKTISTCKKKKLAPYFILYSKLTQN